MTEATGSSTSIASNALQAYEKGDYEQAVELFKQAHAACIAQNQLIEAAEMANNLSVALIQLGKHTAALAALEGTFEVFVEHADHPRAAQALGNSASAHEGLENWSMAEELYQAASDRFSELGDAENQRYTLQALSRVRLRQGRPLDAVATMQGALDAGKPTWRSRLVRKILSLPSRFFLA